MPKPHEIESVTPRNNWTLEEVEALYQLPFMDLLMRAQRQHRAVFTANTVQISTLMSIKTGACPEDCKYCSQSGHYKTEIDKQKLVDCDAIVEQAKAAKARGATRFCMGAAWRCPPKKAMPELAQAIQAVKGLGMEACLTAGMLSEEQATELKTAGLDYYNHNLDTSPDYYEKVVTTRSYQDRLDTLENLRKAKLSSCCGGILGLGESDEDRKKLLIQLANLPEQPSSVPLNLLVPIPGTPFGDKEPVDPIDFVRTVALARIMLPHSYVRLSAGRNTMSESTQALCFMAGANSIHYGEKLLTTPLPTENKDLEMLAKLGITPEPAKCCDNEEVCEGVVASAS